MLAEQQNRQVTGSAMKVTFAVPVPDTVAGIVSQHILFSAVKIYLPSKSPALDSMLESFLARNNNNGAKQLQTSREARGQGGLGHQLR